MKLKSIVWKIESLWIWSSSITLNLLFERVTWRLIWAYHVLNSRRNKALKVFLEEKVSSWWQTRLRLWLTRVSTNQKTKIFGFETIARRRDMERINVQTTSSSQATKVQRDTTTVHRGKNTFLWWCGQTHNSINSFSHALIYGLKCGWRWKDLSFQQLPWGLLRMRTSRGLTLMQSSKPSRRAMVTPLVSH